MSTLHYQLHSAKQKLKKCVRSGRTKSDVIYSVVEEILSCSNSLASRYSEINVLMLLQDNCRNASIELPAIITALGILEKYGKNLVRPDPPPQWRVVRLSNAIFHTQVDVVRGSRDILMLMGYTEKVQDGFAFPRNVAAPSRDIVSAVTSDIILLKYELAMLTKGQHPCLQDFPSFLLQSRDFFGSLSRSNRSSARKYQSSNVPKTESLLTSYQSPSTSSRFSESATSLMDDLCVVCGQKPAEFHCEVCKKQQCASCDEKWHMYPNRVQHKRNQIRPIAKSQPAIVDNLISPLVTLNTTKTSSSSPVYMHLKENVLAPHLVKREPANNSNFTHSPYFVREPQFTPYRPLDHATFSSATPAPANDQMVSSTSSENLNWDDRFAEKKNELKSIRDPNEKRMLLANFFKQVDQQIKEYKDGAKKLQSSLSLSKHLVERSEFLEEQKRDLQKLVGYPETNGVEMMLVDNKGDSFNMVKLIQHHEVVTPYTPPVDPLHSYKRYSNHVNNLSEDVEKPSGLNRVLSPLDNVRFEEAAVVSRIETTQYNKEITTQNNNKTAQNNNALGMQQETVLAEVEDYPNASNITATEPLSIQMSSLNELNLAIMQENARLKCVTMIDQMRQAELDGFSPRHIEIAIDEITQTNRRVTPYQWLCDTWQGKVDGFMKRNNQVCESVVAEALLCGSKNEEEISKSVAHIQSEKMCIVSQPHLYDDHAANAALCKTNGNCAKALAKLQRPLMQEFHVRLQEPVVDELLVKDFMGMRDRGHMQDAIIAMLSVDNEAVVSMMCSLILHCSNTTSDSSELILAMETYDIKDILEAASSFPDNIDKALKYLNNKCMLCLEIFPQNKVKCMTTCGDNGCTYCQDCLAKYLEIQIREGHIRDLVCPVCKLPDNDDDEDTASNHFNFVDVLVRDRLSVNIHNLLQEKIRDHTLMKMPKFRWCSHCENGFLYEGDENVLKMVCSACRKATCYSCKKPWEDQHEGLSCQAFLEWKQMNDPEIQAAGLAAHLKENGIDCPGCKFRYALAKGGCMHFKCTQCSFQFCSGCKRPFKQGKGQKGACTVLSNCAKKGLHAHHPRDCLFYLRDLEIERLQKILSENEIQYGTESKLNDNFCQVPEQKETSIGSMDKKLVDEVCGREVHANHADLCDLHYKEYLVNLINDNKLDPASVFTTDELRTCLERTEINIPIKPPETTEEQYWKELFLLVKTLPLIHETGERPVGQSGEIPPNETMQPVMQPVENGEGSQDGLNTLDFQL